MNRNFPPYLRRLVVTLVLLLPVVAEIRADTITSPPWWLKPDPFYHKHINVGGVPVLGSEKVSDAALHEAVFLMRKMLEFRPEIVRPMARSDVRIVVMHSNEMTTDVPEQRRISPKKFWNLRARGLGGRITSCGEENLLNLPGDRYATENILIHEFAHCMHGYGLNKIDKTFNTRLKKAYSDAVEKGLWKNTYAGTSAGEYWAEGVQSWFETNRENDALHNHVNTREEIKAYDEPLSALLMEVYGDLPWRYTRYDVRETGKAARFRFLRFYADREPGEVGRGFRFADTADIDGDGDLDVVAGGGGTLFVYRTGGRVAEWKRLGTLDESGRIDTHAMLLVDVDHDGDLDIVGVRRSAIEGREQLGWWAQPPRSEGRECGWRFRPVGEEASKITRLALADLDGDGRRDEVVAMLNGTRGLRISWYSMLEDPFEKGRVWPRHDIGLGEEIADLIDESDLHIVDVDRDGHLDIAFGSGWYRSPGRSPQAWTWQPIVTAENSDGDTPIWVTRFRDLDADGDLDLLVGTREPRQTVSWYECPADPRTVSWKRRVLLARVPHLAGLDAADFDGDGDLDLLTSAVDLRRSSEAVHRVFIHEDLGAQAATRWRATDISSPSFGCWNPRAVDLNGDGRPDVLGIDPWTGTLSFHENGSPPLEK